MLPIQTRTLGNGLTVVVSEDHTSPTVGVSVVYRIGMRREPQGRSGFAHLFRAHDVPGNTDRAQGRVRPGDPGRRGVLNGSTRADYTNYISSAPVSALEPILWLEADRMKTLDFSAQNLRNQQDVVKEESASMCRTSPTACSSGPTSRDSPSPGGPTRTTATAARDLEGASLQDVAAFHRDFYGPNNAVIGIVGDIRAEAAFALVEKYSAAFRPAPCHRAPTRRNRSTRREAGEPDGCAGAGAGGGARLEGPGAAQRGPGADGRAVAAATGRHGVPSLPGLVKGRQIAVAVEGGFNWPLGDSWDFSGPALLTVFALYRPDSSAGAVVSAIDEEVARIAKDGVDAQTLARLKTRLRANYVVGMEPFLARADELAKARRCGATRRS